MQTKRQTKKKQKMEGKMLSCRRNMSSGLAALQHCSEFESKFNTLIYSGKSGREKEKERSKTWREMVETKERK